MRKLLAAATIVVFSSVAHSGELTGIRKNNAGVKKFLENKAPEAYADFTDALADLPFTPEAHYNLGNTFLANKEFDKALSEYREAIRLAPGNSDRAKKVRFVALFNTAAALVEQKKVDEALAAYQAALEIDPLSVEVKTNIELLSQQGGGGQGDSEKQDQEPKDGDEKKEGQGQDEQQKQPPPQQGQQQQKQKPKPFKSEQLTNQDVNRILDELKRQEEQVRAKMERQNTKDAPPDKDW